jgi:hypothetical protein
MNLLLPLTAAKVAAEGGVTAHEPNLRPASAGPALIYIPLKGIVR